MPKLLLVAKFDENILNHGTVEKIMKIILELSENHDKRDERTIKPSNTPDHNTS